MGAGAVEFKFYTTVYIRSQEDGRIGRGRVTDSNTKGEIMGAGAVEFKFYTTVNIR